MHEFGIAKNIFDAVCEEARKRNISKVISIKLEVGKLTAIVPDVLDFAFETITNGTFLEGTKLEIIDMPFRMRCSNCKNEFEVIDYSYICPRCQGTNCELISGDELNIKNLGVE